MDIQKFTIPNRLACYGELVATCANNSEDLRHREAYNIKLVRWAIGKTNLDPVRRNCTVHIHWVEPSARRRHAHVAAGAIFIEQALLDAGIISDPIQIECIYSTFAVNADNPRVEVSIEGARKWQA